MNILYSNVNIIYNIYYIKHSLIIEVRVAWPHTIYSTYLWKVKGDIDLKRLRTVVINHDVNIKKIFNLNDLKIVGVLYRNMNFVHILFGVDRSKTLVACKIWTQTLTFCKHWMNIVMYSYNDGRKRFRSHDSEHYIKLPSTRDGLNLIRKLYAR